MFTEHHWATAFHKTVFLFYSLKTSLCYKKIIPEVHDKKLTTQSWIFDQKTYFIKSFAFTDIIKLEIGFSSLYPKGLLKILFLEKLRSLERGGGEGIPLKKDGNRWEKGALMVRIIVKEENSKKFLFIFTRTLKNLEPEKPGINIGLKNMSEKV